MTLAYRSNDAASLSLFSNPNGLHISSCRSNICNNHKEATQMMIGNSGSSFRNLMVMLEIRKNILTFRDTVHLPPCNRPIKELVMETIEGLHKQYPKIVPEPSVPEMERSSISQELVHLYTVLKCIRDSCLKQNKSKQEDNRESLEHTNLGQLGQRVKEMLEQTTKIAGEVIQTTATNKNDGDVEEQMQESAKHDCDVKQITDLQLKPEQLAKDNKSNTPSNINCVMSNERLPHGPPLLLQEANTSHKMSASVPSSSVSLSREAITPSRVPISTSQISVIRPIPPPQPSLNQGAPMKGTPPPPPPPPLGSKKVMYALKSNTKLKRSNNLGNLYRQLKRKLDGSNAPKKSKGKKFKAGASGANKEGMSSAIAEMMKRSSYYQQIEKDVQNHGNQINEIKLSLISFQNKDMQELIKFHNYVEAVLERLTDETQVLARFEGFPRSKLESIRSAAALYTKLDGTLTTLKNWKIQAPLSQLLDKVENYFNKIKQELDELERHKDEDSKRFQSESIHFNFQILQKIKESMVDVSSGCIELALREKRRTTTNMGHGLSKNDSQRTMSVKLLWRAFQLAFRVYIFAGGQDDQAERLTTELAQEIETDAQE